MKDANTKHTPAKLALSGVMAIVGVVFVFMRDSKGSTFGRVAITIIAICLIAQAVLYFGVAIMVRRWDAEKHRQGKDETT